MSITIDAMTSGSPHLPNSNLLIFLANGGPAANGAATRPAVTAVVAQPVVSWARNGGAVIRTGPLTWFSTQIDTPFVACLLECGMVLGVAIADGGEGFSGPPTATSNDTGTGGSGCTYGPIRMATGITSYVIGSATSNYPYGPSVTISDTGGGTGASGYIEIARGRVTRYWPASGGSGYTSATTMTLNYSGVSGSGATLAPVIVGGQVVGATIISTATNHSNPPAVTVPAPSGTAGPAGNIPVYTQIDVSGLIRVGPRVIIYDANAGALAGQVRAIIPFVGGRMGCGTGYAGSTVSCTIGASPNGHTPAITGNVSQYVDFIPIVSPGDNYNSPPSVILTGGSPTRPAVVSPIMTGVVSSDVLTYSAQAGWLVTTAGSAPAA